MNFRTCTCKDALDENGLVISKGEPAASCSVCGGLRRAESTATMLRGVAKEIQRMIAIPCTCKNAADDKCLVFSMGDMVVVCSICGGLRRAVGVDPEHPHANKDQLAALTRPGCQWAIDKAAERRSYSAGFKDAVSKIKHIARSNELQNITIEELEFIFP